MNKKLILHPYLFVIYGVLSLIANNLTDLTVVSLRVLVFSTIACTIALAFFYVVLKDRIKASLVSSVATLLIFTLGHVKAIIQVNFNVSSGVLLILTIIWWGVFFAWFWVVIRGLKKADEISSYFTTVSLLLLIFPVYTLSSSYLQTLGVKENTQTFLEDSWKEYGVAEAKEGLITPEILPDVFYIILDGYSRSDILENAYGYDNSVFEKELKDRGFYVAYQSRSNYAHTAFSLGSSMNMIYLDKLPEYIAKDYYADKESLVNNASIGVFKNNAIMEIFKQQGYEIVSFDTGFEIINFFDSDYYMAPQIVSESIYSTENLFDIFFFDTFFSGLNRKEKKTENSIVSSMYDAHRERIKYSFEKIPQFASMDGNYFVFAHIMAPHHPYVFGPDGEKIDGNGAFTLDGVGKSSRDYKLYVGEIHYINSLVVKIVDQILKESENPPIIIIQGDHGSRFSPSNDQSDEMKDQVHYPILNTFYFPELDDETVLYPSISPVNTFRIILNNYFEANLGLLEDRSFHWDESTDYDFVPIKKYP